MNKADLFVFKSPQELANEFAYRLMDSIENHSETTFHIAISGGKTPDLLFSVLAEKYAHSALWQKVHFWWVDERMVPPAHPESNFGVVQRLLFSRIAIPEENIHRIKGENDPEAEALSYSGQIRNTIKYENEWPVFDVILLGMGDDGHTASIFPNQLELLESDRVCEVANHPQSGQMRITLTGKVLNNAKSVFFLVTGKGKTERVAQIINQTKEARKYPAFYVAPDFGEINWYLDEDATKLL